MEKQKLIDHFYVVNQSKKARFEPADNSETLTAPSYYDHFITKRKIFGMQSSVDALESNEKQKNHNGDGVQWNCENLACKSLFADNRSYKVKLEEAAGLVGKLHKQISDLTQSLEESQRKRKEKQTADENAMKDIQVCF